MHEINLALILTGIGMGTVFFVLLLFSLIIAALTRMFKGGETQAQAQPASPATASPSEELLLYGVDEPTAAMLMAIVAQELQTPLTKLNFRSIKATKGDAGA